MERVSDEGFDLDSVLLSRASSFVEVSEVGSSNFFVAVGFKEGHLVLIERGHVDGADLVGELSVYAGTRGADEGTKGHAHILHRTALQAVKAGLEVGFQAAVAVNVV